VDSTAQAYSSVCSSPGITTSSKDRSRPAAAPRDLALMPDAHQGKGATVGSVIPAFGAVTPAAVGVDCSLDAGGRSCQAGRLP